MILPFGYTVCLKIHSKVIGIFWLLLFLKLQLIPSVLLFDTQMEFKKWKGHTGWASTCQFSWNADVIHMSIQMAALCKNNQNMDVIDNIPRFVRYVSAV